MNITLLRLCLNWVKNKDFMSNFEVLTIAGKANAEEIVAEVFDFVTKNMSYLAPFVPNYTFIHKAWLDENPLSALRVVTSRNNGALIGVSMHLISPNPKSMNDEVILEAIKMNPSLATPSFSQIVLVEAEGDADFIQFINAVTQRV